MRPVIVPTVPWALLFWRSRHGNGGSGLGLLGLGIVNLLLKIPMSLTVLPLVSSIALLPGLAGVSILKQPMWVRIW